MGGEPGVSGRWATALWWLDQLGLLATKVARLGRCRGSVGVIVVVVVGSGEAVVGKGGGEWGVVVVVGR